jgi:leucyl aminopeptidase
MSDAVKIGFVPFSAAPKGVLVLFTDESLKFGPASAKLLGTAAAETVKRAATTSRFKGRSGSSLDILAPAELKVDRLIVTGTGKAGALKPEDFIKIGGATIGRLRANTEQVTIVAESPGGAMKPVDVAAIASGVRLRAYTFDRYKTKKKDDEERLKSSISFAVKDVAAAKKAFAPSDSVTDGVIVARDLVNEPPNILYPEEFANRAAQL